MCFTMEITLNLESKKAEKKETLVFLPASIKIFSFYSNNTIYSKPCLVCVCPIFSGKVSCI